MSSEEFVRDEVTGYLVGKDGQGIQARHKTAFLKAFKRSGNQTTAIESLGFTYAELEPHFKLDAKFAVDFKAALAAMKHAIEAEIFQNAFKPTGNRDRQMWLEMNFPEQYGRKSVKDDKKRGPSSIDELLERMDSEWFQGEAA